MKRLGACLCIVMGALFCQRLWADAQADYQAAKAYINNPSYSAHVNTLIANANTALTTLPRGQTPADYYDNPAQLSAGAAATISQNQNLQAISQSVNAAPRISMDSHSDIAGHAKQIENQATITTEDTSIFCQAGDCDVLPNASNQDFGSAGAKLAALGEGAKEVADAHKNSASIRLFTGRAAHCREVALHSLNCCADSGWARGIFASCNSEEKSLGHAKEAGGLVVYSGRYCAHKVLGHCVKHEKGYCIFPSRMAFDVQVGGRGQLHRDFGDGKHPNCSGLRVDEVTRLDFDKLNFSNVESEVMRQTHLPDTGQTQNAIAQQVLAQAAKENADG